MGKKAIQWPGKAEFLWRLPAAPLHLRSLPSDTAVPFFGKKQLFTSRAVMQTGCMGCSDRWLKPLTQRGWAENCQILQKTIFPESLQTQTCVSFHHYSKSLSWNCQNSAFLLNSATSVHQAISEPSVTQKLSTSLFPSVVKTKKAKEKKTIPSQGFGQ